MSEVLNHFETSLSNVYVTNPKTKFNRLLRDSSLLNILRLEFHIFFHSYFCIHSRHIIS